VTTSLFLLGTAHKYQCGGRDCSSDQAQAFATQVHIACRDHNIHRIAEEMTVDGRKNYHVEETIAQGIARELAIHHHEVDLSKFERNTLSITDSAVLNAMSAFQSRDGGGKLRAKFEALSHQVRERIWAARIMNNNNWPVLFILGAGHVTTFRAVWRPPWGKCSSRVGGLCALT
jgi:hypothetical protein